MPDGVVGWAIVLCGATLAGLVQGMTGFAFSIIALSFWAWALAPETAAPLAVLGALLGQLSSFGAFKGGFAWGRLLPFVIAGVFGVPLGVFLLHNIDPVRFRLALGILFALYAAYGLSVVNPPTIKAGGRKLDAVVGGIGGILGGLGGLSGSVPAIWTQLRGWKRDVRRAVMQVYNITMHCVTLTVYSQTHALNATAWKLFAIAAAPMLVANFYGMRIYRRFSERGFARLVLVSILVSGLALVLGATRDIWRR